MATGNQKDISKSKNPKQLRPILRKHHLVKGIYVCLKEGSYLLPKKIVEKTTTNS